MSCAIVRPETRIVVWARWARVNPLGTGSLQWTAPSASPRRFASSSAKRASSASSSASLVYCSSIFVSGVGNLLGNHLVRILLRQQLCALLRDPPLQLGAALRL